ncbi:MAG: hypothetical protein BGO69_06730 [Bacteroidetes bacterium 46-16]|nr:MAG: hypothetical protein BGO69_06730 [Bacteroidetes bacterium 46-16]
MKKQLRYILFFIAMQLYAYLASHLQFPTVFLQNVHNASLSHMRLSSYMTHSVILSVVILSFLHTIWQTVEMLPAAARKVQPRVIWFILLPQLGFLFVLPYVIVQLSRSLHVEFSRRGMDDRPLDTAMVTGLLAWASYLLVLGYILFVLKPIGYFKSDAWLILFIIHWVQISRYRNKLARA